MNEYNNKTFAFVNTKIKFSKVIFKLSDIVYIGNIVNTDIQSSDILNKEFNGASMRN
jgi:predicted metallo-beta-lactamase superfamily hydrolase